MLKKQYCFIYTMTLLFAYAAMVQAEPVLLEYDVPQGSHHHDVAPASDGGVWYTAQHLGALGYLDPVNGEIRHILLGENSAPHGVIVGPDGSAWITDSGLIAIVRVDSVSGEISRFPLPEKTPWANLNTATFDKHDQLWFTGQTGYYGRLNLKTGKVDIFAAPRGRGP